MKTFVIKQIYWHSSMSGGIQRCPNSLQIPEKNIVYYLASSGRPQKEWKVMDDGTLYRIHDTKVNATVHEMNGKWFWTPHNGIMGSFREWEPYEIEIEDDSVSLGIGYLDL